MKEKIEMKTLFKIVWISLLSTIVNILTKILVDDNFLTFLSLDEPKLERFHIEYTLINLVVFTILTIVFMQIKKYIPSSKLTKGIVYSLSISVIWFALKFDPTGSEKILQYIFNVITFFIPMMIYGIFLGYLSSEKTFSFKISESFLSSFIYLSVWVLLRVIYINLEFDKGLPHIVSGTLWLVITGTIIGIVFGLAFDLSYDGKKETLRWILLVAIITFGGYYLLEYTLEKLYNPYRFIAVGLDVGSVMIATLINFKIFGKNNPQEDKFNLN